MKYLTLPAYHNEWYAKHMYNGFAMWDSKLTKWNAKQMGPKRYIIGDLSKSVRTQGMKFGISNHRMFGYDLMVPSNC